MWHIKKFKDNAEYNAYLRTEDVWLPRISYILNDHEEHIDPITGIDASCNEDDWSTVDDSTGYGFPWGGDNHRWFDAIKLGNHFIEIANGNVVYFTDVEDKNAGWYHASFENGVLKIITPDG